MQNSMISSRKPMIGVTPDRNAPPSEIESQFFVRRNYCAAITASGGAALILPYDMDAVELYLDQIDGLMITGGMFDVDPAIYGMPALYPGKMLLKEDRTGFEQALLRGALQRDMPVLGICGGMQLIAVELGGKLLQHIPSDVDTDLEHKQVMDCDTASHVIHITRESRLHAILGVDSCQVNSLHHQSVMGATDRIDVTAVAEDGVVESIEIPDRKFCLGVQWHPEYLVNDSEQNIFRALVTAAQDSQLHRV